MIGKLARRSFTASIVLGLALAALAAPAAQADPNAEAMAHFDAGVAFLSDPEGARYEDAHAEFQRAFRLSGSANVLGNLGLTAMKLERDGEAIDSYTRYLAEARDIDPAERAQIERDLQTLRVSAVRVDLTVENAPIDATSLQVIDKRVAVSGPSYTNTYPASASPMHLVLHPGHHSIRLRSGDVESKAWEFDAAPGTTLSHSLVVEGHAPVPATQSPTKPARRSFAGPIVVMGIGAAGFVAGGILGGVTLRRVHQLEEDCPAGACTKPDAQSDIDAAHTYVRATDYTFLASGIVMGAGVAWLVGAAVDRPAPVRAGSSESAAWRVAAVPMSGGAFATFGGDF